MQDLYRPQFEFRKEQNKVGLWILGLEISCAFGNIQACKEQLIIWLHNEAERLKNDPQS